MKNQKSKIKNQNDKSKFKNLFGIWFVFLVLGFWILDFTFAQQKAEAATSEEVLQNAQKHYLAGKELIQQGNFSAANEEFKKAQGFLAGTQKQIQPPSEESFESKAIGADKKGDLEKAISFYLKAVEAAPKKADLNYNLALVYLKAKKYKEAAGALKQVIQFNPKDKDAYYNLGILYESYLGDRKKALDYYAQYIKYSPGKDNSAEVKQWIRQLKKELKE